jgi:hypothetical protein
MQTFHATVRGGSLWTAVFLPPGLYLLLIHFWGNAADAGSHDLTRAFVLLGLSQAMPLMALAWMLCSVAGYSIGAGKIVVHRVVRDLEYSLDGLTGPPRLKGSVVMVPTQDKRLRLRVGAPQACLDALRHATGRQ